MNAAIVHSVAQGSQEWLALRARHYTASEAPAMMGCSPPPPFNPDTAPEALF